MTTRSQTSRIPRRTNRKGKGVEATKEKVHTVTTKERILEVAGRLFAERGHAEVTVREICDKAEVNIAAINYHFGNRDKLYLAVFQQAHDFFAGPEFLLALNESGISARAKLEQIIDRLAEAACNQDCWQAQLWAREFLSPSIQADELHAGKEEQFNILDRILSDATGISLGDPALHFCLLQLVSPIMVLLFLKNAPQPHRAIPSLNAEASASNLKTAAFAAIDALASQELVRESDPPMNDKPT